RLQPCLDPPLKLDLQRHRRTHQLNVPPVRTLTEQHQLGHPQLLP
ncbi:hypothetical protein G3I76_45550, partial [Streptomyces sp. SID11233]|nr:hypothetical protein [Streptomyces sp. SID11233]